MEPVQESSPPPPLLPELIASLEQATLITKQLSATTDPSLLLHASSSLRSLHHQLSAFLSHFHLSSSSLPFAAGENSVSSAVGCGGNGEDEPMQIRDQDGDEVEEEENSMVAIDKVEERLRNCVLQNKRRKRPLSPASAAAVDQRRPGYSFDCELVDQGYLGFDPEGTRLRSLDLVFQFHG